MTIENETVPQQAIGRKQSAMLLAESAIGTVSGNFSDGDRIDILNANISETLDKIERVDKRQSANIAEVVAGKRSATWETESYVLCAAAGVEPDIDKVFDGASMEGTVVGSTSVTYNFADTLTPFALLVDNEIASQLAYGCVTESLAINFDGTGLTRISASGIASYAVRTGTSTLSGNEAAAQTELSVTDASYYEVGGYVGVGADDNSGDGYRITAVDEGADTITVTPALAVGASSGDVVAPIMPSGTTTGTPIPGILGSVTFGGDTMCVIDGSITINNEFGSEQDKYGVQSYTADPVLTDRRVVADLTLYGKRSNLLKWVQSRTVTGASMVINVGDTAPNRLVITMPLFVQDLTNLDVPETEYVTMKITGKALKNAGNDELSIKFY